MNDLVKDFKQIDVADFDRVLAHYYPRLKSYIKSKISDPQAVDEVVQDTFLKAYRSLKLYNPKYCFSTWLFAISRNKLYDYAKKEKRLKRTQLCYVEDLNYTICESESKGQSNNIKVDLMRYCISELPDDEQKLIDYRYNSNITLRNLANHLNTTEGALSIKLYRIKDKLKNRLSDLF